MPWPEGTNPELEIETDTHNEEDSVARFVTWIPWDSGFRGRLKSSCQELLRVWNRFKEMTKEPEWAIESRDTLKSVLDAMR